MIARDTLAFRTLLAVARQRPSLDEPRCRLVLELLSTAAILQSHLHRELEARHLTELKLGVLAVLFMLDPSPCTPADLAVHVGATPSALSDVLAQLETRALIRRTRDALDRRITQVHLTRSGHQAAEGGLVCYLAHAGGCARDVSPEDQRQLLALCLHLNEGGERLPSAL